MRRSSLRWPLVFSARTHLVILAFAILLPMLVFSGLVLLRFAETERSRIEFDARDTAREISLAVERELVGLQSTLTALALSPLLRNDDLEAFHGYATEVGNRLPAVITVRSLESRQLLNTNTPWGKPPPAGSALRQTDMKAQQSRNTVISDVFMGVGDKRRWIALVTPVIRGNDIVYFLSLSVPLSRVQDALQRVPLAERYTAQVADRKLTTVARSLRPEDVVGTPMQSVTLNDLAKPSGLIRDSLADGVSTVLFFERSATTGWVSTLRVPTADLNAPLRRALWALSALGLGLTALSLLLAFLFSRRLAMPLQNLMQNANALAGGEPVTPLRSAVREINTIGDAMAGAAVSLDRRRHQRDAAELALRAANENLEATVAERTRALTDEMKRREIIEGQFRQAQKIEAVGQLTGGIAHDFNNMMAIVMGNLQLLQKRMTADDAKLMRFVDHAMDGARRAAVLTKSLLSFSRQTPLEPVTFDANRLVAEMSEILRRTIPQNIEIETVLAGGLWRVHADYNALENAVLNLVLNARDAMPNGGKVTIETANTFLDDAYAATHPDVISGQYVMIAVTDQGEGIPAALLNRVFDPFFTTKPPGKGTGLGLSQVHGYIKQSGGHIKVYSEPKQGAVVKLYLPRTLAESAPAETRRAVARSIPATGNNEVVLVVEDEESVRSLTVEMLCDLGYTTIEAPNGRVALELLDANPAIALLFTDVVMPGMNGRELADETLRRRPGLKILFTTGYTRNAIIHNGVLDNDVQLIMKPFTIDALAAKLRLILAPA